MSRELEGELGECLGPPKARISCQDRALAKTFDLNNKPKFQIRYVCCRLNFCMEGRFLETRGTGFDLASALKVNKSRNTELQFQVGSYED
jgi:hypothetical protein